MPVIQIRWLSTTCALSNKHVKNLFARVKQHRIKYKRYNVQICGMDLRRVCIVDLDEITFIDKSGERFLRVLARSGAQFAARGIYTKRVLEQLNLRRKRDGSNLLGCLIATCVRDGAGAGCDRSVASALAPPPAVVEVTPVVQKDLLAGSPSQMTSLAATFLASDDARWITGQVIVAAGGKRM